MPTRQVLLGALISVLAPAALGAAEGAKTEGSIAKLEELTPEEQQERDSRKDCKIAICGVLHNRQPAGGDISCNIVKSWRKEQLTKLTQKAKVSWPWGAVRCNVNLKLHRDALIKAMSEGRYEMALDKHEATCEVERAPEPSASVKFEFSPRVSFENGKAVKASLNWGKVEAPTLVKGAMWTATATDNSLNVLQSTVVEDVNDFVDAKCTEVKDEWTKK
jgi:hypothetical protein